MNEERKHIDNYFADSLGDHVEENLDLDLNWSDIESKLDKYAFFRFSMNRFNIYYLGIIVLNITIWFFVRSESDYSITNPILHENPKPAGSLTTSPNGESIGKEEHSTSFPRQIKKNTKGISGEDHTVSSPVIDPITTPADTVKTITADVPKTIILNSHELEKKNDSLSLKKIKPPVVINRKRDTIIKVDTVYINKKKRK